jgi:tetratricopeptide (TPR) repeat protein
MEIEIPGEDNERVKYMEPPQLRAAIFQAVGAYFEALAVSQPLVLVFDDVHWIDATSLDLLESLLPLTDRVPLMILALFRPRRNEPSWKFHETASRDYGHRYKTINLSPLGESSSQELVENLLHIDGLPRKARNLILAKAEGNPFFMEEVIRSMLDMGLIVRQNGHWRATREIENIAVPDTLASVITTRLDRLEDEARQVLQTASIIGREFPYDVLASTHEVHQSLDLSLLELQRRELISEKSPLPQRSYMFKHALTQETAYATLLLKKRRALHKRVAEYLERAQPDRVADIARHFLEAREPQLALPYLIDAGDHAAHAYATPEAIAFYKRALKILETAGNLPRARRAYEGLGNILTFANEFARAMETYQTMLDLAEKENDIPMQVSALNKMSFLAALRLGDFEGAERHLSEADRRARQFQDKAGLSEMSMIRCMMCTAAADFDGVIHHMDEMVELGKDLDAKEQMVVGLSHISSSQIYLLHFEDAWKNAQAGLKRAREIGDREHESEILVTTISLYHYYQGDLDAALKAALEGREIARKIGSVFPELMGARGIGHIAHLRGDYQEAIRCFEDDLRLGRKVGAPWVEADAMCLLGTVYLEISPSLLDKVVEYHDQAIQIMEHPGGAMLGGSAWTELGFCMYAVGKYQEAASFFHKGLTIPTILSNLERPRLLVGAANLAISQKNVPEAERLLKEARDFVDEKGLKCHDSIVTLAQASLSVAQGQQEEALAHLKRMEDAAQEEGLAPYLWQARAQSFEIMNRLGHQGEAEVVRGKALATIDKMGKQFEDENMRKLFLENAMEKLI